MRAPWVVRTNEVAHLTTEIFSPNREDCLVVVSPASDTNAPRVDPDQITAASPPGTVVAVLSTMATSRALTDDVTRDLTAFGGACRVYRPYASRNDSATRHPLILTRPHDDPADSVRMIAQHCRRHGADRSARPRPATPPPVVRPVPVPTAPAETDSSLPAPGDTAALTNAVRSAVEPLLREVVTEVITDLLGTDTDAEEVQRLRTEVAQLREELDQHVPPEVFAEPIDQLRWELTQQWLTSTPEAERESGLPEWTAAAAFLAGLDDQIVPRRKTIQVMVEILTGAVWDRRKVHQCATPGGQALLDTDGAVLWRAHIKTNSPGAPRIHWWARPDGSVDFCTVGHHDATLK